MRFLTPRDFQAGNYDKNSLFLFVALFTYVDVRFSFLSFHLIFCFLFLVGNQFFSTKRLLYCKCEHILLALNLRFRDNVREVLFTLKQSHQRMDVYNYAKKLIVAAGLLSLRKMMWQQFAFSTMIVPPLMSLAQLASAVKVDVKKNFPQQQLLLQQQLMIHQVIILYIIFCLLYTII